MEVMKTEDRKIGLSKKIISFMLMIVICASCCITSFAANYESEPNNSIGKANTISVNTTYYATGDKNSNTDDDYYKFTTSSDGYVQISAEKGYEESSLEMYLYKYDGTDTTLLLNDNVKYHSEKNKTAKIGLAKGTYYLCIDFYGDDYNFIITFTPSNKWEKEFNNNVKTANTISVNTTYYGTGDANSSTDADYYKFSTSSDGYIQINAAKVYEADRLDMYLYKYDGTEQTELLYDSVNYHSETTTTKKIYLSKGTYYLCIDFYGDDYNFQVLFSTSGGEKKTSQKSESKTTTTVKTTTAATAPSKASSPDEKSAAPQESRSESVTRESSTYVTVPEIPSDEGDSQTIEDNNYTYIIINYTVIITDYHGDDEVAVVPSETNTPEGRYEVTGIGDNAFRNSRAKTIQIPSSVNSFGRNAFGEDDGTNRVIICEEGSPAAAYCSANGIRCEYTNLQDKSGAFGGSGAETKSNKKIIIIILFALVLAAAVVLIVVIIKKDNKKRASDNNNYLN